MNGCSLIDGVVARLDLASLAWAAGFFDGEGSTIAQRQRDRPGYFRLVLHVPQHGPDGVPQALVRFQRAVLGFGQIDPPNDELIYVWRSRGFIDAQATVALLWRRFLSEVKRAQAHEAMRIVAEQYTSGRYLSRLPHFRPSVEGIDPLAYDWASAPPSERDLARAWAAGFLDAEGCFGLVRSKGARKPDRPPWFRIRASATQYGEPHRSPEVLRRLREALDGTGAIERHSEPNGYKWAARGDERVQRVLEIVQPWIGTVKSSQARTALAAFRAEVRLKGSATHCVRGHAYTHTTKRGGRLRRVCNACSRLLERQKRAAQGIKPRLFKNAARRYDF